jgi:hypothetical protein
MIYEVSKNIINFKDFVCDTIWRTDKRFNGWHFRMCHTSVFEHVPLKIMSERAREKLFVTLSALVKFLPTFNGMCYNVMYKLSMLCFRNCVGKLDRLEHHFFVILMSSGTSKKFLSRYS